MIHLKSHLPELNLHGKRIFLRADLNVPLKDSIILNDHRLQAVLATIDLIQAGGGKIILATHIGRPKNQEPNLSTRNLMPWFEQRGYTVTFQSDLAKAHGESYHNPQAILLLENMRFYSGEKTGDKTFAEQLARLGDFYVNDAFGALHRSDSSITLTPNLFPPHARTIGLLVEKELAMLNKLLAAPKQSFALVLGGGKVADKLPLLHAFLDKISDLFLCPALVFTFAKAEGLPVGKSMVDDALLDTARDFLRTARAHGITIHMPSDYMITHNDFNGPLMPMPVSAQQFPANAVGISIGPKTAELYASRLREAKTIFFNGLMGSVGRPETLTNVKTIFEGVAESQAFSVIGGGDSVAAAQLLGFADSMSYLSTGGGATLTYLSGQPLPGLQPYVH